MRVGNVFSRVCLSVFLSVQAITFELLHIETSLLVCRHILIISRSSLSIKVIGSRSRSHEKKMSFTYFTLLILCMWLYVINKVKVAHQGEGHIKVKVKYLHPFKFYAAHALCKRVVCIRMSMLLVLNVFAHFHRLQCCYVHSEENWAFSTIRNVHTDALVSTGLLVISHYIKYHCVCMLGRGRGLTSL